MEICRYFRRVGVVGGSPELWLKKDDGGRGLSRGLQSAWKCEMEKCG